jgi:succinoglycan biosynthesis protein ExoV
MEIRESDVVLAEAMHGAIVSDALRVPWIPIQPIRGEHRMKWHDWTSVLNIELRPQKIACSNFQEFLVSKIRSPRWAARLRRFGGTVKPVIEGHFLEGASESLKEISRHAPSLSSDVAISLAHEQMLSKLDELLRDLAAA